MSRNGWHAQFCARYDERRKSVAFLRNLVEYLLHTYISVFYVSIGIALDCIDLDRLTYSLLTRSRSCENDGLDGWSRAK